MTDKDKNINKVPNLRFPGFESEWEVRKLKDIATFYSGGTPLTSKKEYFDGNIPFIRSGEINSDKTEQFISELGLKNSSAKMVEVGDVLYALYGATSGEVGISKIKGAINQAVLCIKIDNEQYFLASYLRYKKEDITKTYLQGGQGNLSAEIIKNLKISFPSIQEQKKISDFLSSLDSKIQTQRKTIQNLESLMKGMSQKLFTQKIRFKEFTDEWKEIKLEEVCVKQSSNISANKIEDNFGDFPIYGATGFLKNVDFYEVEKDYIAIIKDGAGVGRLFLCSGKSSVLGTLDIIKPKNINLYFLYCLLSNINFDKYSTGSTIPHIYFKDYKNEFCQIPCIEEQTKIADFLSKIYDKIETEKKILELLEQQKKYFLQNLFI